jgi:hypothetical protein
VLAELPVTDQEESVMGLVKALSLQLVLGVVVTVVVIAGGHFIFYFFS